MWPLLYGLPSQQSTENTLVYVMNNLHVAKSKFHLSVLFSLNPAAFSPVNHHHFLPEILFSLSFSINNSPGTLPTSLSPYPLSSYSYILGLSPGSSYFFSIQTISQVDFIHFQSIKNTDMFLTPRFLTTILMSGLIHSTAYLTCSFGCLIGISHLTCPCGPYRGLLSI